MQGGSRLVVFLGFQIPFAVVGSIIDHSFLKLTSLAIQRGPLTAWLFFMELDARYPQLQLVTVDSSRVDIPSVD